MKLYPCQKIALAEMDDSSDRTNDGIMVYSVRCRSADRRAAVRWLPKEDDRYIKEVLREKLCRYCEWREDDGETEEICPV